VGRNLVAEFWAHLSGTIHPADGPTFAAHPHSFNLAYPPPAFVGDLEAPVVVLMANGGFRSEETPLDFAEAGLAEAYTAYLNGKSKGLPPASVAYYRRHPLGALLENGGAVMVNAVAYRSPHLSREPENLAVAEKLASVSVHRAWMRDELLPAAGRGERLVVVHRNGLWRVPRALAGPNLIFSPNPISAAPAQTVLERIGSWRAERGLAA
jgi:hypothetical protein